MKWQPREWNGKRWVKRGKCIAGQEAEGFAYSAGITEEWKDQPPKESQVWWALEPVVSSKTPMTPLCFRGNKEVTEK
jgi:hypothetical protein